MSNSSNHDIKYREITDASHSSSDAENMQKMVALNQELSKERYRTLFWELARRLAIANTGEILIVQDDFALWLQGHENSFDYDGEETKYVPYYETYGYNSQEYAECAAEVNKAITQHQANLFAQRLQSEYDAGVKQAAELGFPSNLHFPLRDNDPGPSCQTWIIGTDGLPRVRDYVVGESEGQEFYEGWLQLLPGEVIASWKKPSMSEPHYFKLEMYLDAKSIPQDLAIFAEAVPSSALAHVTLDSDMLPLGDAGLQALSNLFTTAMLECLGDLQANIDCGYRDAVDPINGEPSPDIAGGWLILLGIEQSFKIDELDESDIDEEPNKTKDFAKGCN